MKKSKALWAFVLFLSMDVLVFRLPVYSQFVKPHSYTGALVQRCQLAREKEQTNLPLVAFVGDSRMREGFSQKYFDEEAIRQSLPVRAAQLAVTGSTLRVWYYLLKHVDPDCRAFKLIVIGLPSFYDEDYSTDLANNMLDLQLTLPTLKAVDTPDFVGSFEDKSLRNEVLLAAVLKSYGYRRDVKDFVLNTFDRLAERDDSDKYWEQRDYLYEGDKKSLAGISIRDHKELINVPSHLSPMKLDRLKEVTFPGPNHPDFWKWHYLEYWLNRLARRYEGSATKLVIVCVPNKPLPVQRNRPHRDDAISEMAKYPNVCVFPEDMFASLNKPEYFWDDIHLNVKGRSSFTKMLSEKLLDSPLLAARTSSNGLSF
jgi:hypothetical protein